MSLIAVLCYFFFFQAEDGIRDWSVTGVQTCALPIFLQRSYQIKLRLLSIIMMGPVMVMLFTTAIMPAQAQAFDTYLQRINPDGTLPWSTNRSNFDTRQARNEMETAISFNAGSDFI